MTLDENDWLAERFEENRTHLRTLAYRMLGSASEAEDAVQETWLRLSRSGASGVENLGGWLTTVVARVCLDMLRSRKSRREDSLEEHAAIEGREDGADPEREAVLADSIGLAMLVVLETLAPAERVAFVLHDMFDVPFDEIASIVGRSPEAARQLASRARRRVQGQPAHDADLSRQREVVNAFLAAARNRDFEGLLAVLDPDVVVRADRAAMALGAQAEVHGAMAAADHFSKRARGAQPVLVDGVPGLMWAPRGTPKVVFHFTIAEGKIVGIDLIGDAERIGGMEIRGMEG
jgi:RNA polymerase sigma-70 factor (ECF subfamily)